jgi:hypothetical protein
LRQERERLIHERLDAIHFSHLESKETDDDDCTE